MANRTSKALPALLAAAVILGGGGHAAQKDPYLTAHERYIECMKRKPFRFHVEAREGLTKTHDPRALDILMNDYANALKLAKVQEANDEESVAAHTRYTLATMFAEGFAGDVDSADKLDALRRKFDKDGDAWLWIKVLTLRTKHHDSSDAMKIAKENKSVALRAAAIVALVEAKQEGVLELIPDICADMPKSQGEKRMLIAAMGNAILANAKRIEEETFQRAARAFIGLLDEKVKLVNSTKMVISRHLAKAFNITSNYIDTEAWLHILKTRSNPDRPKTTNHTVTAPRLFGIEARGDRICYVVDFSDSMCKIIPPDSKPAPGPVTGAPAGGKKKKDPSLLDESDIPWHLVNNRFDLAREHLKISIRRLTREKRFCVVVFGTEVKTLDSCEGMIEATAVNIEKVVQELDSIKPGDPSSTAPDGRLMGRTNLHGGIRRAFALRKQGIAEVHEYVDRETAELGCDTVFLISDGEPTWDDFDATDKDFGEGKVVDDVEYGAGAERTANLQYQGPYIDPKRIVEDVRRMNVFRKAQIHAIAIGEADVALLRRLAEDSMGEVFVFGGKKPK